MKLVPNVGSNKSWVWNTPADISDGEPQAELLAIRFGTPEIAQSFKAKFEEAQKLLSEPPSEESESNIEDGKASADKDETVAKDSKTKEE